MNIWALSCFFNFNKSKSRLKNYKVFRKHLKNFNLKLLTVEFAPDGDFQLYNDDADVLIQISNGDLMWQKERLLNIGLHKLPTDCDIVIAIDTDVIFGQRDIIEKITEKLKKYKAIQCFSEVHHLNPLIDVNLVDFFDIKNYPYNFVSHGGSYSYYSCVITFNHFGNFGMGLPGYVWAFRYETLLNIGFFDRNIQGSGDKEMAAALLDLELQHPLSLTSIIAYDKYKKHLRRYINRDEVGCLDHCTPVYDLYHGEHSNRGYDRIANILSTFNPLSQLIGMIGEPFTFSNDVSDKFKEKIRKYFVDKKEDN
jgi:hypothetical protein